VNRPVGAIERIGREALAFGVLRGAALAAGLAALFIVPLRPEHQLHLAPLLAGFIVYNAALLAVLARWAEEARAVFLAALAADLALVFLLVWFTGGSESHYYLLFYLLVTLNAYYFGPGIGLLAAGLAAGLLAAADWLSPSPVPFSHIAARGMVLAVLALALGHVAARERAERARVQGLDRELGVSKARLARAEQLAAVGRLSAKMAHEVRNPLGSVNLNVDLLGDLVRELPEPAAKEAQGILQGIKDEVRGLADLTEEYLVSARLPNLRVGRGSLNELLNELVGFLRPTAERQGVDIAMSLDATLPPLPFDPAMLRLALRNLVKNGIEALPQGGRINVKTGHEAGAVLVTVADSGPGITEAAAARMFEPFFTTKPGGTGLGLSISDEIARAHGGEMTWRSQPGEGAEFTIRLPLRGGADG
jgi:signal transduction histidine kinase